MQKTVDKKIQDNIRGINQNIIENKQNNNIKNKEKNEEKNEEKDSVAYNADEIKKLIEENTDKVLTIKETNNSDNLKNKLYKIYYYFRPKKNKEKNKEINDEIKRLIRKDKTYNRNMIIEIISFIKRISLRKFLYHLTILVILGLISFGTIWALLSYFNGGNDSAIKPDGKERDGEEPDGEEPDGEQPDGEEAYIKNQIMLQMQAINQFSGNFIMHIKYLGKYIRADL
ncbi:MAG: hypothetical protein N4A49_03310 [Marinifilaceae bacterium]|jgi:hypothetical protein|nr:hypothetical protein [Marinifilaceae bacterium]